MAEDRSLPSGRGARRRQRRRRAMGVGMELPPPAAADGDAAYGQGFPLLLPVAAAAARGNLPFLSGQKFFGGRASAAVPPGVWRGEGEFLWAARPSPPDRRHAYLVSGRE